MKYITIEFRILNFKPNDILSTIEEVNRKIDYNKFKLGENFVEFLDGKSEFEHTDCPFCGTSHTCLINDKIYSADSQKRILEAKCVLRDKSFSAYQELSNENLLN